MNDEIDQIFQRFRPGPFVAGAAYDPNSTPYDLQEPGAFPQGFVDELDRQIGAFALTGGFNSTFGAPPRLADATIDNTTNALPSWKMVYVSGTAITPSWVTDASSGPGGYVQLAMVAGAAPDDFYLEGLAPLATHAGGTVAAVGVAAYEAIAHTSANQQIYLTTQYVKADKTTVTGTAATDTDTIGSGLAQLVSIPNAGIAPTGAAYLRMRIGFKRNTAAVGATATLRFYSVRPIQGDTYNLVGFPGYAAAGLMPTGGLQGGVRITDNINTTPNYIDLDSSNASNATIFAVASKNFQTQVGSTAYRSIIQHANLTGIVQLGSVVSDLSGITGTKNNYAPGVGSASILYIAPGADVTITGISASGANATSGRLLMLWNLDANFIITLKNQSASSTAANRIYGPDASDYNIYPGQAAWLVYDAENGQTSWHVLGARSLRITGLSSLGDINYVKWPDAVASNNIVLMKQNADTAYRVRMGLDASGFGKLEFGPGGVTQPDMSIVRTAANRLDFTGSTAATALSIVFSSPAAAASLLAFLQGGDSQSHLLLGVDASGRATIYWGTGSAAVDVRLYRSATKTLTLDDNAGGNVTLSILGALNLTAVGDALSTFTGGALSSVGTKYLVTGDTQPRLWAVVSNGQPNIVFGSGSALDLALYRSGAKTLTLDDNTLGAVTFNVVGTLQEGGARVYKVGGTDVALADGGTGSSTAAGAATNLGLGTGDSPQFTGINVGNASDTTISRASAGDIAVEGNRIFRVGGVDVPIADGGTGASTALAATQNLLIARASASSGAIAAGVATDVALTWDITFADTNYRVVVTCELNDGTNRTPPTHYVKTNGSLKTTTGVTIRVINNAAVSQTYVVSAIAIHD